MSKVFFNANNKVGETMSFQTNAPNTTTFDPTVALTSGSDRVSWDFGDGGGYIPGNSVSHTYSDTGDVKTVTIRTNTLSKIASIALLNDFIVGNLDATGLDNLGGSGGYFMMQTNPGLTSVTHSYTTGLIGQLSNGYDLSSCDITGNLDMTWCPNLTGQFRVFGNNKLTSITHTANTQTFSSYYVYSCNLTGDLDLSLFSNFGGDFRAYSNTGLTSITHSASSQIFNQYRADSCNLTGAHDLSMLTGLGGSFNLSSNSNLTEVIHTASTQTFSSYQLIGCNLTGNHDVSMLSGLGGAFYASGNANLTGLTHGPSTNTFSLYHATSCDLTGDLDLTPLTGISGNFNVQNNPKLTSITHTGSSATFSFYTADRCHLTGSHDISMLSGLTGSIQLFDNPNMTNVIYPNVDLAGSTVTVYSCGLTGSHSMSALTGVGSVSLYSNSGLTNVIHGVSSEPGSYDAYSCGLTGVLDLSMLSARETFIRLQDNPGLTSVILPTTTGSFRNTFSSANTKAFNLDGCKFSYFDFKPLSGATMATGTTYGASINIQNNNMATAGVNQILVELDAISTANPSGWSGVILDISGTNSAPDGSSGGYDGDTAAINLSAKGWTVTTN